MSGISRRGFIGSAGVAGAAAFSTASSYAQVAGANHRLRLGIIGCGGMGNAHMRALLPVREADNFEIAAVCDVFDKRAQAAAKLTGGKPYRDYRELLADKTIDYVLIATPEHWHYQMILDAADAGKHIYCEKPMTHTSDEARDVVRRIANTNLKVQVGVQGMSDNSFESAYQYIQQGALGKVVLAQIDYSRNYLDDFWAYRIDEDARPGENFDWDMWLGPSPKRPFDPERAFRWRRYWDYSSGIASDLFVHRVTRLIKALNLTFPERGVGLGGKWNFVDSLAEIPDTFNTILDYPGGPTVLLVSSMANDTPIEHVIRGHKATLRFTDSGFVIQPQTLWEDSVHQKTFRKSGAEATDLHHRNLLNAIRYNAPLKCDVYLGWYGVVACEMGVRAMREQRYMLWDKTGEKVVAA